MSVKTFKTEHEAFEELVSIFERVKDDFHSKDVEIEELKSEIRKWLKFDPSDDELLEARRQSEGKNKDFKESLLGNSIYIATLEQKIRKLLAEIEWLKSERRWIPVSERLPKTSNVVLAFAGFVVDFLSYFDSEWHVMFDEDWTACNVLNYPLITHWMPLPTPPEDE